MTVFIHRSVDRNGETHSGRLEAPDLAMATASLHAQGLTPVALSENRPNFWMWLTEPHSMFGRPTMRDVQAFLRDLSRLLRAGLALDAALHLQAGMTGKDEFRSVIEKARDDVRKGGGLASALGTYDALFTKDVVAAVHAGEMAGQLPSTLTTVSEALDKALTFRESLRSALIYPTILLVMVTLTVVMVTTFVMPQFAPLFEGNEDRLPALTRLMMGLSGFFTENGRYFLGSVALSGTVLLFVLRTPSYKNALTKRICALPVIGHWIQQPDVIRFTRTLGTCLDSGLTLDRALLLAVDAVRLDHLKDALARVRADVRNGRSLAVAINTVPSAPMLLKHFLGVGEQSGQLGPMLKEAAGLLEQDYEKRLQSALEVVSPALTILLGGIVVLLVGAVLLGIMSINDLAF